MRPAARAASGWDLVVVGAGAAGLGAARAAARRGARTLLVEAARIGGDCTFVGCVPSKTLIAASRRGRRFAEAMGAVRRVVATLAEREDEQVLEGEGIRVVHEEARFLDPRVLQIGGRRLRAGRVVIATGSHPTLPPVPGLAEARPLTNETVFELDALPSTLGVIGGGPIGCELAQAFQRLGAQVILLEVADRLLLREEPEASQVVHDALVADGVGVRLGARLLRVEPGANGVGSRLQIRGAEPVSVEAVLVAAGRSPTVAGLALEAAGVETGPGGWITTDRGLRTSAPGIWAAGDVTGRMAFTHAADAMGRLAARNALRRLGRSRFRSGPIPWVTFTEPEVGRVGMTEAEAAAHGGRVAFLPMDEVDRALTAQSTAGFVKLIAGPRRPLGAVGGGRILGGTFVAERGGELADEVALAMRARLFTGRLAQTVHAYPTWSWGLQKAAAQFFITVEGRRARPARAEGAWAGPAR